MSKIIFGLLLLSFTQSHAMDGHNHGSHDHKKMKMDRMSLSKSTKTQVLKVLEVNEELHASFFKYDAKKVEVIAKKLKAAISNISDANISKLLKFSQTKLAEIKTSNDQETNNQSYHLVSMALIHIVNKYDVGSKYNAYSCPMVKKKWVQNSSKMDKVHNPYSADMPHCGTKDTNH